MRHEDGVVPHSGHPNLSPLQLPFFIPQKYTKIGLKIFFFFFLQQKKLFIWNMHYQYKSGNCKTYTLLVSS